MIIPIDCEGMEQHRAVSHIYTRNGVISVPHADQELTDAVLIAVYEEERCR